MDSPADDLDLRRRRLAFRMRHRGIKEMDLILGRYADEALDCLGAEHLTMLEALVEVPDRDLYAWIIGSAPVPERYDNDIMAKLKALTFATTDYGSSA